jgi:hypothetical protein
MVGLAENPVPEIVGDAVTVQLLGTFADRVTV